jgi:hypothetical protein
MPLSKITTASISTDAATANTNIDNGTFFVDVINNRVGVNTTTPGYPIQVTGSLDMINVQGSTNAFYRATNKIGANTATGDWSWGADDGPALGGVGSFIIYDRKNTAYRMVIDSSGRVMMPQQPYARGSAGSNSGVGQVGIDTYITSRGGMVTTSNRFTVPVSGAYGVGYHHLGNSGSGACVVYIRKNGAKISGTLTQDVNSGNDSFGSSTIVELAANDYIDFYCQAGSIHGNSDYNSMWIWLIG